jgi:hypothetical protein
MATIKKRSLATGIVMAVTFAGMLAIIFSPIFGENKNGLIFADDLFNKLSKGSSYFIPKVAKTNEEYRSASVSLVIRLDKPEQMNPLALRLLAQSGATAQTASPEIRLDGNLGGILAQVLADADALFQNDGSSISARYGADEKEVLYSWWYILKSMDKELKKQGRIGEAKMVSDVMKKAVEPAYNYYGVIPRQVSEKAGVMTGLLVFYVAYTMWWGFSIYYIFEGIGLTMKKARVKKEV